MIGSGTKGGIRVVLDRRTRMVTTSFRAPLSLRVDTVSRSALILDDDDSTGAPYLLSKRFLPETS